MRAHQHRFMVWTLFFLCLMSVGALAASPLQLKIPDKPFTLQNQASQLQIPFTVLAPSAQEEPQPLVIELVAPKAVFSEALRTLSLDGEYSQRVDGKVPGLDVQGGAAGQWTVWLGASEMNQIKLRIRNDVSATNERQALTHPREYGSPGADGGLTVRLPLPGPREREEVSSFEVDVRYGPSPRELQEGTPKTIRFNHDRQKKGAPPVVTLKVAWMGESSSKTRQLGDTVELHYRIERARYGTISGPMEGRQSLLQLPAPGGDGIISGVFHVRALGRANYILEAEVLPTDSTNPIRVFRSANVDVPSLDEYANLALVPATVLPGGQVNVHWATWGLKENNNPKLVWTDHRGYRQVESIKGTSVVGDFCFIPPNTRDANEVSVQVAVGTRSVAKRLEVRRWQSEGGRDRTEERDKPVAAASTWLKNVTGGINGLAVSRNALVLSTTEGMWQMGLDTYPVDPFAALEKVVLQVEGAARIKEWLGVVALREQFVGLCRIESGDAASKALNTSLALVRFSAQGGKVIPVDLPDRFKKYDSFQMLELKNRIYVTASTQSPAKNESLPRNKEALSMDLDAANRGEDRGLGEPRLSAALLPGDWSLVTVGDTLYALSRNAESKDRGVLYVFGASGQMDKDLGTLSYPKIAGQRSSTDARKDSLPEGLPLDAQGQSLVTQGVPVNVGGVLVLLGANEGSSLASRPREPRAVDCPVVRIPQDLAYNPQTNIWSSCGNGLKVDRKTLIASLDGKQPRLWAIQPETREASTLAVDSPQLFASDYLEGNPVAPLNYSDDEKVVIFRNTLSEDLTLSWEGNVLADISPAETPGAQKVAARSSLALSIRSRKADRIQVNLYIKRTTVSKNELSVIAEFNHDGKWSVNALANVGSKLEAHVDGNTVTITDRKQGTE